MMRLLRLLDLVIQTSCFILLHSEAPSSYAHKRLLAISDIEVAQELGVLNSLLNGILSAFLRSRDMKLSHSQPFSPWIARL